MVDSGSNIFSAAQNVDCFLKIPCSCHRLNLSVNDIFNERIIKERAKAKGKFYVKDFDNQGKLLNRNITLEEKIQIEVMNKVKSEIGAILKKCKRYGFATPDQIFFDRFIIFY